MSKKTSKSKLSLGFTLLALGLLLLVRPKVRETPLNKSFSDEPVEISGFLSSQDAANKNLPKRIIIPDLGIDLEVKRARIIEGFWEVFEDSAGWGEGSGFPGEIGNQVIFAHARQGLFLPLRKVKAGMRAYVLAEGIPSNWFSYEVSEIKEVSPNQVEVIDKSEDERLTLYTCSGFQDEKRLIVVGKRV